MSYETIPVEMKDSGTVHVLTGKISEINLDLSKADIDFDDYGSVEDVPIFYHCENEETADKESGEEKIPFVKDDEVVVVNLGSVENLSASDMKVVGFADGVLRGCWIETVYVKMKVGSTERVFIWDVSKNEFSKINNNEGEPVAFPCEFDEISNWFSKQEAVGQDLFQDSYGASDRNHRVDLLCGSSLVSCESMLGDCPDYMTYGKAGSCSGDRAVPSDCGCDFIDIGECSASSDFTAKCWCGDSWWEYAGPYSYTTVQNILWEGFSWEKRGPAKLIFQNNREGEDKAESAFRIELQHTKSESHWSCDGAACWAPCADIRLDSGVYSDTYNFYTPFINTQSILEIKHTATKNFSACNDTGAHSEDKQLIAARLNPRGVFSDKIIAQIYTVETRTRTRNMPAGAVPYWGGCCGTCVWEDQVYETNGLNLAAQVGVFKGDDFPDGAIGVDPTELIRNNDFELAINNMYDDLRDIENVPEADMAVIGLSLHILRGLSI